jgi:hypothetical protein
MALLLLLPFPHLALLLLLLEGWIGGKEGTTKKRRMDGKVYV